MSQRAADVGPNRDEPALRRELGLSHQAPEAAADTSRDAFLLGTRDDPSHLALLLRRADAGTRLRVVSRLQRERGNAQVQRLIGALEASGRQSRAVQRQGAGAAQAEEFRVMTISVVRDPILEALRRGDAIAFLNRMRALSQDDRRTLESDQSFVDEFPRHLRGLPLWIARIVLKFGRDLRPPVRDLQRAVSERDAQRIKDLLRTFVELTTEAAVPGVREMLDYEFRGTPEHAELRRLTRERELAVATRQYSFEEAHYERPEGGGAYRMQQFTGEAAYEIVRTTSELRVVVRIRFVHPEHSPGAGETYYLPDAKAAQWRNGIEASWNSRFIAFNGRTRLPIVFVPMFTDVMPHHEVEVMPGMDRSDESHWYIDDDGSMAAHEFGHMVGNPDEYSLPGGIAEIPATMGLSTEEEMRSSVEGIGEERRHREGGYTLPGIMGANVGPAERRHVWPILEWYNANLRPAAEAPYRLQ